MDLPGTPGSYAICFRIQFGKTISIGSLGEYSFYSGIYVYFGSALGFGGLRARLKHHILPKKTPHWHIDYLMENQSIESIWFIESLCPQECNWSSTLYLQYGFTSPVRGFGSSDCRNRCPAHLLLIPPNYVCQELGKMLAAISNEMIFCMDLLQFQAEVDLKKIEYNQYQTT